eukprot:SAG22_NODE_952_length_6343_cov_3.567265_5_plen_65_part_00
MPRKLVQQRCRVCNKMDDPKELFDPCNCYKKRETGLVHPRCLKELIEKHQVRATCHVGALCCVC